jgi:hypothetical protein
MRHALMWSLLALLAFVPDGARCSEPETGAIADTELPTTSRATGVLIGSESWNRKPAFAVNDNAGTLFCVKFDQEYPGDNHDSLRTYISTDDGLSWTETYVLPTGPDLDFIDLDVVAVAGYFYVAYATEDYPQQAKIRRFRASDGAVDADYGYKIVIDDPGIEIRELALASNADSGNNSRLRYFAIQDNLALRYFWTDHEGGHGVTPWNEVATGITDANGLLDATYAEGHTGTYVYAAYRAHSGRLMVARWAPGDQVEIESSPSLAGVAEIRVSAYAETVVVAFTVSYNPIHGVDRTTAHELKVRISHDGGDTWTEAALLSNLIDIEHVYSLDLSLRHDQGIVIIWNEGGSIWMRFRELASSARWSEPILLRNDATIGYGVWDAARIEAAPGLGWGMLHHWVDDTAWPVVFDRAPVVFFDGFESSGHSHWTVP